MWAMRPAVPVVALAMLVMAAASPASATDPREQAESIGATYGACAALAEATHNEKMRQQCENTALMALRSMGVCVKGNRLLATLAAMEKTPPEMYTCDRKESPPTETAKLRMIGELVFVVGFSIACPIEANIIDVGTAPSLGAAFDLLRKPGKYDNALGLTNSKGQEGCTVIQPNMRGVAKAGGNIEHPGRVLVTFSDLAETLWVPAAAIRTTGQNAQDAAEAQAIHDMLVKLRDQPVNCAPPLHPVQPTPENHGVRCAR